MGENAELLSYCDEKSSRTKLVGWLHYHNIEFSNDMSIEELRQLYIDAECGKL